MVQVLQKFSDIQVVAEAANGEQAIELVEKHNPDVLLLDLEMPVMDGIEVLDHLQRCGSKVRTLIVSAYNDNQYIAEVLSRGAWGYCVKDEAPTNIVEAVRQAVREDGKETNSQSNPKLIQGLAPAD